MRRIDAEANVKVLIVDDNYEHGLGIRELLSIESDYQVVGTVTNAQAAVAAVKKSKPDIVLMDVNMPEVDGITAIQEIRSIADNCKFIAVTGYDDSDLIFRSMKVGARGYVLKTMAATQLIMAVKEVANGKIYLPPMLTTKFFDYFYDAFKDEAKAKQEEENLLSYLTQREEEVLELLTQGITYKGVASRLFISETTVKTHVNNIFQKLQVNDRTQAVLYAINHGLGKKRMKKAV